MTVEPRDDRETLEHLQSRWAARPNGQGVRFERTAQRLGLHSADERAALSESIQRLISRGLVEEVHGDGWHRYRLTSVGSLANA